MTNKFLDKAEELLAQEECPKGATFGFILCIPFVLLSKVIQIPVVLISIVIGWYYTEEK
jgi:hypothetical protein